MVTTTTATTAAVAAAAIARTTTAAAAAIAITITAAQIGVTECHISFSSKDEKLDYCLSDRIRTSESPWPPRPR